MGLRNGAAVGGCLRLDGAPLRLLSNLVLRVIPSAAERVAARQAALVRPWLEQTAGKVLPFAQAAACFPEFTPEAVAQDFLRGLGG